MQDPQRIRVLANRRVVFLPGLRIEPKPPTVRGGQFQGRAIGIVSAQDLDLEAVANRFLQKVHNCGEF